MAGIWVSVEVFIRCAVLYKIDLVYQVVGLLGNKDYSKYLKKRRNGDRFPLQRTAVSLP